MRLHSETNQYATVPSPAFTYHINSKPMKMAGWQTGEGILETIFSSSDGMYGSAKGRFYRNARKAGEESKVKRYSYKIHDNASENLCSFIFSR